MRGKAPRPAPPSNDGPWSRYVEVITELAPTNSSAPDTLAAANIAIHEAQQPGTSDASSAAAEKALSDTDLAAILEMALQHIIDSEPALIATIRAGILPSAYRRPIDGALNSVGQFSAAR